MSRKIKPGVFRRLLHDCQEAGIDVKGKGPDDAKELKAALAETRRQGKRHLEVVPDETGGREDHLHIAADPGPTPEEEVIDIDLVALAEAQQADAGKEVVKYVDGAMFDATPIPSDALDHPVVHLISATPDPLGAVAAMSMMYEGRVITDLSEITNEERKHYFDECFKTTLKAPLEAIDLHFMVEGVTRAHTHQEVRQRTAVFAQESMRFAVKDDLRESVRPALSIKGDKERLKRYWEAIDKVGEAYHWMVANGVPAEDARGLLPHDTLTRLHHKVNLRNIMDELGKRLCTQAQFEWRFWAAGVQKALREHGTKEYWQFEYIADSPIFVPICFNTGACMFKAAMDRGCTIRERVEAGRFDEIRPEEWAGDPTAAWVR